MDGYTKNEGTMPTTPFGADVDKDTYLLSYANSIVGITLGSNDISGAYLHVGIPNADAKQYPDQQMVVTCSSGSSAFNSDYKGFKATITYANKQTDTFDCRSSSYNIGQIITFDNTKPVSVFVKGKITTINISPI